jgi:hypothetical protein
MGPTDYVIHVPVLTGAMMGMMDAYELDYDRMDGFIEELRDRVGKPPQVNLTDLANRGKVSNRVQYSNTNYSCVSFFFYFSGINF